MKTLVLLSTVVVSEMSLGVVVEVTFGTVVVDACLDVNVENEDLLPKEEPCVRLLREARLAAEIAPMLPAIGILVGSSVGTKE